MTDLENRRRYATEMIAEDESLTADLVDDAAALLLDWGVARAKGLPQEELDSKLVGLRRTMKRISRQAGEAAPETQAEQVQTLLAEIETEQTPEADNGA